MADDRMDEVVGRVERGLAGASDHTTITDSRGDCLNTEGDPIFLDVSDLRKLLAAYQSVREDKARLDWLESEYDREQAALVERKPLPRSLFRQNNQITRTAIDHARARTSGENAPK